MVMPRNGTPGTSTEILPPKVGFHRGRRQNDVVDDVVLSQQRRTVVVFALNETRNRNRKWVVKPDQVGSFVGTIRGGQKAGCKRCRLHAVLRQSREICT